MFNFHKPRIYRSTEGCCICKAKSSSSRFTDSRKYERDTMQCFDLKYPRQGEICNACVLLVKRFKRLPLGSKRNWSHIVDAKAGIGPGYNKIQTKYKSERINSKAAAAAAQLQAQQQANSSASSSSASRSNNNNNITNTAAGGSGLNGDLCFLPEKFSKIYKKSKKLKNTLTHNSKRKIANNGWSQSSSHSLAAIPDSMDSDYEDTRLQASLSGSAGSSTVVQFQTQTRASAYKALAAAEAKKKRIKLGTKRRKCLQPRKYCRSMACEESLQFFDEEEWCERKSCCGMLYECAALAGAILIDVANYKPCEQHRQRRRSTHELEVKPADTMAGVNTINNDYKNSTPLSSNQSITQTMPAVVQLQPPQGPPFSLSSVPYSTNSLNNNFANNCCKTPATTETPTTPVLKKHHLFFKRQSECFPQGDMVTPPTATINTNNNSNEANFIKTESSDKQQQKQFPHDQHQQNSTTLQRHVGNSINVSSTGANSSSPSTTMLSTNILASLALSFSVTSVTTSGAAASSAVISTMQQMPKHSLAQVTTLSPPISTSTQLTQYHHNASKNSTMSLSKTNSSLHRTKNDSGKIVKHSLDKLNMTVQLKTSDINEMKPIIRSVDKSYMVAKLPPAQSNNNNIVSLNTTTAVTTSYQSLASYNAAVQPSFTTTSLSAASPTSSISSTSSTKFSDNSSDSGFDENMLDRKSVSPLQEDFEKKFLSRPGVQTMFLSSGVQIQGQPQNFIPSGNEVSAKVLQNRKYNTITTSSIVTNSRPIASNHHHPATTAVKIAQISTSPITPSSSLTSINSDIVPSISMSSAAQAKMRAIYNNNNTIQHENGITTIVPASSLAASTQTAAMQNIAPSTVTITPAPPVGSQFNAQNSVISRKLTTANIINLQSNTTNLVGFNSSHNNNISGNHHHPISNNSSSSGSNHNHSNTTNQKVILLKTSNNTTTASVTASANYNTLIGGGCAAQLGGGSGNGGR